MKCINSLDSVDQDTPLRKRIGLSLHLIFCKRCSLRVKAYKKALATLQTAALPASPDLSDAIMNALYHQSAQGETETHEFENTAQGWVSIRGWVIAGVVMLLSFATAFFNQDFASIAREQGNSFLLPLGIMIGSVITAYGALFVASNLKKFSQWLKL